MTLRTFTSLEEAVNFLLKFQPCDHGNTIRVGYASLQKCEDCGLTFDGGNQNRYGEESENFKAALCFLYETAASRPSSPELPKRKDPEDQEGAISSINSLPPVFFKGICHGVGIWDRGPDDPHQMVSIYGEDDENWFLETSFSSYWLERLISLLQQAQRYLNWVCEKEPDGFGYKRINKQVQTP